MVIGSYSAVLHNTMGGIIFQSSQELHSNLSKGFYFIWFLI